MKSKKIVLLILWILYLMITLNAQEINNSKKINVIPKPNKIEIKDGQFTFDSSIIVSIDTTVEEVKKVFSFLDNELLKKIGINYTVENEQIDKVNEKYMVFKIDKSLHNYGDEGYILSVSENKIESTSYNAAGLFYSLQTLRQLLPSKFENDDYKFSAKDSLEIPCLIIEDTPRFVWRGMLLDCCRHFMSLDFVKRYIDLLAYYKMNRFHWHLTEDQGWRVEIKKHPQLAKISAYRELDDGSLYGGYYTHEDMKEVVDYAAEKFITVVPEIELPGHSRAALAAFPQFSCTGDSLPVPNQWGVFKDVYCAGNDSVFTFLEDVFDEVVEIFPSEYIHIGGDEVPKDRWQNCPKCQKRINDEKLENEEELQSYFINRMNKYLSKKGKRIIGWDEILEGDITQDAIIQSWRGFEGALEAANTRRHSIVSPTSHAYFDYDVATTDLRKVYSFDPIHEDIPEDKHKFILGGECNMWTERAPQELVDSKVFPRILAMTECLWTNPELKNFDEFYSRVQNHYLRLDALDVDYGPEAKPINIIFRFNYKTKHHKINLEAGEPNLELYYTLDESEPTMNSLEYRKEIELFGTGTIKAAAFKNGYKYGETETLSIKNHNALGIRPEYLSDYAEQYSGGGKFGLTDGIRGSSNFRDGKWQGFQGDDAEVIIDLAVETDIHKITVGALQNSSSWIFLPEYVKIFFSDDGLNFTKLDSIKHSVDQNNPEAILYDFISQKRITTRYLKIICKNIGVCPEWHPGAGGKAWIFIDEIIVK